MKNVHFLILAIAFGITVFIFNLFLVEFRIQDINTALTIQAREHQEYKTVGMLGKLELIRARMESGSEGEENPVYEVRLQTLANFEDQVRQDNPEPQLPFYLEPVKGVVNLLRWSFGKQALGKAESTLTQDKLENAYLKERARQYNQAIELYLEILSEREGSEEVRTQVRLHTAFCFILLRQFNNARTQLDHILTRRQTLEVKAVAETLLGYLTEFEGWKASSEELIPGALDRARERYLMMDYSTARSLLEDFQALKPDPRRFQESLYYLAKTQEEAGEDEQAALTYKKTIFLNPESPWATRASKRLYVLGEFYLHRPEISDSGRKGLSNETDFLASLAPMENLNRRIFNQNRSQDLVGTSRTEEQLILFIETDLNNIGIFANGVYQGISPIFLTPTMGVSLVLEGFGPQVYGRLSFTPPVATGILRLKLNLNPRVPLPFSGNKFIEPTQTISPPAKPLTWKPWIGPLLIPHTEFVSLKDLDLLRSLEVLAQSEGFPKAQKVEEARKLAEKISALPEHPVSKRALDTYTKLSGLQTKEATLSQEIKELQKKKDQNERDLTNVSSTGYAWAGWIGMGGGALGLGAMGGALWVGNDLYTQYKSGTTSSIKELRGPIIIAQAVAIAGAVIGGVSLAGGAWFFILDNDESQKKKAKSQISAELDSALERYNQHLQNKD